MTKIIALSVAIAAGLAFAPMALAKGHAQVAAGMVADIKDNANLTGKGKNAASNASLLNGGWGNRNGSIGADGGSTGPGSLNGNAKVPGLK